MNLRNFSWKFVQRSIQTQMITVRAPKKMSPKNDLEGNFFFFL